MNSRKQKYITAISLLSILVVLTSVFILTVTFGGSYALPDATIEYTKHHLEWSVPTDGNGSGILNVFGDPEEGEEYPLIHPFSKGKYYVRLNNMVRGKIRYAVYLYCDNEHGIPLKFNITRGRDMKETDELPKDLQGKQVLDKVAGEIGIRGAEHFEIDWYWDTLSDEIDTEFGNHAAEEDLLYTIHMLIVIEDNNSYYYNHSSGVARLLHRAYVGGYPEGDFRPDGHTTRAETAAIFARIMANYDEDSLVDGENGFTDVPSEQWFAKYIAYLEEPGIINGYSDGSFKPNGSITRAELAAICVRYFENAVGKIEPADKSFADLNSDHWAYNIIQKAVAQRYIGGYPDYTVRPDEKITRAEVVTVVNRMLERRADEDYIDEHRSELVDFWDLRDKYYWAYYDIHEAANEHHVRKEYNLEFWVE